MPLIDTAAAARRIHQALYVQNRVPLEARNRLQLMELYRQPVAELCATLESGAADAPLPLSRRQWALVDLAESLESEVAIGYKRVVQDTLTEQRSTDKAGFLPLAVMRAVEHLGRVLLGAFQVYMPSPQGVWYELHQLYHLAEQSGFEELPLVVKDNTAPRTVSRAYREVLLLGVCSPLGLLHGECKRVYALLGRWPLKAAIGRNLEVKEPAGRFLISLGVDIPPIPFPSDTELSDGENLRVLNAIELVRDVHTLLKRLEQGETPKALGLCEDDGVDTGYPDLLRRMGKLWGLSIRRQCRRNPKQETLSVCIGIGAVYYFLSDKHLFVSPEGPLSFTGARTGKEAAEASADSVYIDLDELTAASPVPEGKGEEPAESPQDIFRTEAWETEDEYLVYQWQTRDESIAGLALERQGDFSMQVRVGDLLALHYPQADLWRVGIARWLKSPNTESVEMGVQLFAPGVRPVAVSEVQSPGDKSTRFRPALLLSGNGALQQLDTLIVPRGTYQVGQHFMLVDGGEPQVIKPLQLLDRTGSVEQIVFAPA